MEADRYNELRSLSPADRLAGRQPGELYMDCFCQDCGALLVGEGYAIGKVYCQPCARAHGVECSQCGYDSGNGAGGYSNCCGAPIGGGS